MTNETGITRELFTILAAPFAAKDHEFNRGFIYITEEAICARIEEVDFSWEWRTVETIYENDMATVIGALTIKGVTRYGTGQQLAQIDKNGKESVGESRKGATTDALKRAARLFGIGRYLLQCPKDVKGEGTELNRWLQTVGKGVTAPSQAPHSAPQRPPAPTVSAPVDAPASAPSGPIDWLQSDPFKKWAWDTFRIPKEGLPTILAKAKKVPLSKGEAKGAVLASFCGYDAEKVVAIGEEKSLPVEVVLFANSLSL